MSDRARLQSCAGRDLHPRRRRYLTAWPEALSAYHLPPNALTPT